MRTAACPEPARAADLAAESGGPTRLPARAGLLPALAVGVGPAALPGLVGRLSPVPPSCRTVSRRGLTTRERRRFLPRPMINILQDRTARHKRRLPPHAAPRDVRRRRVPHVRLAGLGILVIHHLIAQPPRRASRTTGSDHNHCPPLLASTLPSAVLRGRHAASRSVTCAGVATPFIGSPCRRAVHRPGDSGHRRRHGEHANVLFAVHLDALLQPHGVRADHDAVAASLGAGGDGRAPVDGRARHDAHGVRDPRSKARRRRRGPRSHRSWPASVGSPAKTVTSRRATTSRGLRRGRSGCPRS